MKSVHIAALAILAMLVVAPLRATNKKARETIQAEFNRAYDGKVVALQTFYNGDTLHYSATGEFEKGGKPGPWTLDAYIKIKRVKLNRKELVFDGNRLDFVYSPDERKFDSKLGAKVSVAIKVSPASMSIVGINDAIPRVFAGNDQKLAALVPDYWKVYLLNPGKSLLDICENELPLLPGWKNKRPSKIRKVCAEIGWDANVTPGQPISTAKGKAGQRPGNRATTPPVSLTDPEPPYTPEARAAGLSGSVILEAAIGPDGRVGKIALLKPLGMGLDDNAVAAVRTWKFKPATKNGKPVAQTVTITVHFLTFRTSFTVL